MGAGISRWGGWLASHLGAGVNGRRREEGGREEEGRLRPGR